MRKMTLVAASILVLSGAVLPKVAVAQSAMVNGQVTKIDESAGKITLKHGLSRSGSGHAQAGEGRRQGQVRR